MKFPMALIIASFLLIATVHSASTSTSQPLPFISCQALFGTNSNIVGHNIDSSSTILGLLYTSVLIILAVFTVLGLVFAIGIAFNIQQVLLFAKTEALESFMNIVIVVMVIGGIPAFYGAMNFLVNTVSLSAPAATPIYSSNTASGLNINVCNNLLSGVVTSGFENWLGVVSTLFVLNIDTAVNVLMQPNKFGWTIKPFEGYTLMVQLLWDDQMLYFGTMMFGVFLIMLLFIIYSLFPLFFYVGLVLRSFPWTRAAGGSLIGMFIAFWIVFPSLIYAFSAIPNHIVQSTPHCPTLQSGQQSSSCTFSVPSFSSFLSQKELSSAWPTGDLGQNLFNSVSDSAQALAYTGVQIIGLIVALFISYEIVEKIGGLLGAPSLQPQRALGRVL